MDRFVFDIARINKLMALFLPERKGLQKTLYDAIDDAFEAGGKRVRPFLMYETYNMFCGIKGIRAEDGEIAPFMTGLEMIHTASLIHDDLPCMDNDTLRRGKPTTWVTYGEDIATLAADGMWLDAFSIASMGALNVGDDRGTKALYIMASKAGCKGMTGGQAVDVENTGKPLDKEKLDFIYKLKTGALIEAAMMMGAVLGGADETETEVIRQAALDIGLAFQIRDDILDETSTAEELGKPIHSDAENNKTTYVTLYGIEKATEEAERLSKEALEILKQFEGSEKLQEITEALVYRTK